jgi:nucleotide-binding universal stress UspA family protein
MRILLAVDGSDNSYEAVRALKYFGRAEELILLHVLDVPKPAYPMMVPEVAHELYGAVQQAMRVDGEGLLDRIVSLLPLNVGQVTRCLETGSPSEMIVSFAEQHKADLILMGARGLGPVKERLLGSVSHRVLTLAPCATLIVSTPMKALQKILLPLQGPYDAAAAIRFLGTKPFRETVELILMTVVPTTRPPWPADESAAKELEKQALLAAQDFLNDAASRLTGLGYTARTLATAGSTAPVILQESDKIRPDLILMGTHGRRGVTRFVLGSVSHAMLHAAKYPMLVFR